MASQGEKNLSGNLTGFTPSNPRRGGVRGNLTGFTLIELLVSITIIVLISSVFMVNYHNTNQRSELNMAKQKLASDIRLAQNYSLGSKTYDGINPPSGGWGVHFDLILYPKQYVIFADLDDNRFYSLDEPKEMKTLPGGVTVDSLTNNLNVLNIVFFPPNPDIFINTNDVFSRPFDTAEITLKEKINNSRATVTVNYFGLIDTE